MIDTIQLSKLLLNEPDYDGLIQRGWNVLSYLYDGEPKILTHRAKGNYSPFLIIINNPNNVSYLWVELSIPRWLFASNLHLPVGRDVREVFDLNSEYVSDYSGIKFDTKLAKVRRVDYTKDHKISQDKVMRALKVYKNFEISKYLTTVMNQSTVYFQNKGKEKNSRYAIYSKYLERKDKRGTPDEIEMAKRYHPFLSGLLRNRRSIDWQSH